VRDGEGKRQAIIREGVIIAMRERAMKLASQGLPVPEIESRLLHDGLTEPERQFARTLALGAVASERNMRVAQILDSEMLDRARLESE
jgi:hypothetical protein